MLGQGYEINMTYIVACGGIRLLALRRCSRRVLRADENTRGATFDAMKRKEAGVRAFS
jgi:hypothetical protein